MLVNCQLVLTPNASNTAAGTVARITYNFSAISWCNTLLEYITDEPRGEAGLVMLVI